MAENKSKSSAEGQKATVVTAEGLEQTEYVVDEKPDLPVAGVTVTRDAPVIMRSLLEVRKREAEANAKAGQ